MRPSAAIAAAAFLLLLLAPAAQATTVYVSNEKDNSISILDGDSLQVRATVPVGQRPRGIALSKDNRHLYICAGDDDIVEILDLQTLKGSKL